MSPARSAAATAPYDVEAVRRDFPILSRQVHGKPLVYLDNAATTQKPRVVIDAERDYYEGLNANIHRGVHWLSEEATRRYEDSRETARRFLGAAEAAECVFLRGTTEAINLVANAFVRPSLRKGDEVLVTGLEHHSNIVPWQMACQPAGAALKVAPITQEGEVDLGAFERLLGPRTRIASFAHVSNALGTVNPVRDMVRLAQDRGVPTLVDGAQAAPHLDVDVKALGCDFYAMSGHKAYGPTGVGVLYGRREVLEAMPPWQGGGDMIRSVSFSSGTTYNDVPFKFEAGTPNIAGGVALGAALEYILRLGRDRIEAHEHALLERAIRRLSEVKGLRPIGTARHRAAVLSFTLGSVHPHDVGTLLDRDGIAIRTGHHCAMPVMEFFNVPATCRASFGIYNTAAEVDALGDALDCVVEVFA